MVIETYNYTSENIPITINILAKKGEFVNIYEMTIASISKNTELILEKIRKDLSEEVELGAADITDQKKGAMIKKRFEDTIKRLIIRYFPSADEKTLTFLTSYLIQHSLGLGNIELLLDDVNLEEIAVNGADQPVWVYHHKHGWLKTNIRLQNEEQVKHYANLIGRKVGRSITLLSPLLDAQLDTGERANATLQPISAIGNTITIRKFKAKPYTITDFLLEGTATTQAAALLWMAVQYEMSILTSGGTASGKTSLLNALSGFIPPSQRVISIEDTKELQMPTFMHWIPMLTRLPNVENKGEVNMLDLLVNSLRMRPDRIIVGEIRRQNEAEVLFEAIHTGHSVYATVHADNVEETVTRLINPPINISKTLLPAISLIATMWRNRRTGIRRILQIAEINKDSSTNVLLQRDIRSDKLNWQGKSKTFLPSLMEQTGLNTQEIRKSLQEKESILKWMIKKKINTVDGVGKVMANYYTNKASLFDYMSKNG